MGALGEQDRRLPRCVLVDEHDVIIEAVTDLVEELGVDVLGTARTGAEGLDLLEREAPEFAVIGMTLPDMSGIDLARRRGVRAQETALILHTAARTRRVADQALAAGFRAVARKAVPPTGLLAAVRAVLDGGTYVDPSFDASDPGAEGGSSST